jgi:hypothetical protein
MNNFNEKFEDEIANEIYLDCGKKYDFHLLTAQDAGIISTSWEKLKTDVVFKLVSVSGERKCYNHLTDNIDTVKIIRINDNMKIEKVIAPYAFLEMFEIISLPSDSEIYFKKLDSLNIKWIYA